MSLIEELREAPSELRLSSRFTALNGVVYFASGMLLLVWPGAVQTILGDGDFAGREATLVRILGMSVAVIGWFYFFGGRSGGRQVVAASVLDRIILVPIVLIPIALAGVFPRLCWTFAVLDPLLGIIAWYLLARERRVTTDT